MGRVVTQMQTMALQSQLELLELLLFCRKHLVQVVDRGHCHRTVISLDNRQRRCGRHKRVPRQRLGPGVKRSSDAAVRAAGAGDTPGVTPLPAHTLDDVAAGRGPEQLFHFMGVEGMTREVLAGRQGELLSR